MKPRYTGPMIVVAENKGGSYIIAEMTGAVWHRKVAKFRVIPFFARERIDLPEGIMAILDTDRAGLDKILTQPEDNLESFRDYLMDDVRLKDSDDEDPEEVNETDDIPE